MKVTIYTDGACAGNPGSGGWCAILVAEKDGVHVEKTVSGSEAMTTNNRMELLAVIAGLSSLKYPCEVEVVTDSKYVCGAFNDGWLESWHKKGWQTAGRKPVKNSELWKKLETLTQLHNVTFSWIKGHNGHTYNERCDAVASSIARGSLSSAV